jgi:hypothetical protein
VRKVIESEVARMVYILPPWKIAGFDSLPGNGAPRKRLLATPNAAKPQHSLKWKRVSGSAVARKRYECGSAAPDLFVHSYLTWVFNP